MHPLGIAQVVSALFLATTLLASAPDLLSNRDAPGAFPLVHQGRAASIYFEPGEPAVVALAAKHLAEDVQAVAGALPQLVATLPHRSPIVVIGTLGRGGLIDQWAERGLLDVGEIKGQWESFLIATLPVGVVEGLDHVLVIVGSDRRGTAYGVFELSQAVGVSPWHWWADVAPAARPELYIKPGARHFGPPSVKYRGIFINDEDWGLQPWAAFTHEPENADIGPKTYARVFELLLRLKANLLWPAMHPSTRAFNSFRENAKLADNYGIVMGSSHAEPMLRNNVDEWKAPAADYNFLSNSAGVTAYWEERVRANGQYENVYTLGMRGIHDSHMLGPKTDAERVETLERIFDAQRDLLRRHVRPDVGAVPQMFCAYKEVLELYRQGLRVPNDVTIVWPDDNFGYIRNFTGEAERKRSGGSGVYYHISYLGRPLAYLWLNTIPPALIWTEMNRAYEHGADRMWILNVGDIKPAEIGTELFLQMAWDMKKWRHDNVPDFLQTWARREFGAAAAESIASIMVEYYRLNYVRKPEHLQWWMPGEVPRGSGWTAADVEDRLKSFAQIGEAARHVEKSLSPEKRAAFFQLVGYPVWASAAANRRYFHAEGYAQRFDYNLAEARQHAALARQADAELQSLTHRFNEEISGGKWRHLMALEPADNQWRSMRIAPLPLPAMNQIIAKAEAPPRFVDKVSVVPPFRWAAGTFVSSTERRGARWMEVKGLGRTGKAITVLPSTTPSVGLNEVETEAPFVEYHLENAPVDTDTLEIQVLPTHPNEPKNGLRLAVQFEETSPALVTIPTVDGSKEWAEGVLNGFRSAKIGLPVAHTGRLRVRIYMIDPGVCVDQLLLLRSSKAK
jgi:hypothetical protein